ncbi:Dabb family protein [Pontiella agarivorans]|uniref:Dabb family protein n=1 Tax=Pontiella agarivorans TaxID=3038953 RepID=A0ABU5MTZ8_9BACT|nr:Dabb family protein [Pontiella agarivorans]MDZ8117687.1 Dabb family protein [Pontiella agarivorans]
MIKHIVMWKFKDDVPAEERVEMKNRLEALKGVAPTLLDIEVGLDVLGTDQSKDIVLYSEFASLEDLKAYAEHPEHVKVGEFIKPRVCERHAVDYEV